MESNQKLSTSRHNFLGWGRTTPEIDDGEPAGQCLYTYQSETGPRI